MIDYGESDKMIKIVERWINQTHTKFSSSDISFFFIPRTFSD